MSLLVFALMIVLSIGASCKRIHKKHPEMVGRWGHRDKFKNTWVIEIGKDSWGTVTLYDSTGKDQEAYGENGRFWRYNEKNGNLTNGIMNASFTIQQFPRIAETKLIKKNDTIEIGETYCIIDNGYYSKAY